MLKELSRIQNLLIETHNVASKLESTLKQVDWDINKSLLVRQKPTIRLTPTEEKLEEEIIDKIAFLLPNLELINHYSCVWELLPNESFVVILINDQDFNESAFKKHVSVVRASKALEVGKKYRYLVSNHPISAGKDSVIKKLGAINIRFMYAAGKSGWNFAEWNSLYDVIMCYGPYHARIFESCTDATIIQMGYPRFDRFFKENPNKSQLLKNYACDAEKRTIVWLPTWKTLSSVGYFDAEISALTERFNVIVKLHPLMEEAEPERVQSLLRHNFTYLIRDSSDNMPLYQLADYMLCDYGGSPLASIYTDKPLILLNVPDGENDPLTGKDSPDIVIRNHIISIDANKNELESLLLNEEVWKQQKPIRAALRRHYFAPYHGFSSQVAAETLSNLNNILYSSGEK